MCKSRKTAGERDLRMNGEVPQKSPCRPKKAASQENKKKKEIKKDRASRNLEESYSEKTDTSQKSPEKICSDKPLGVFVL